MTQTNDVIALQAPHNPEMHPETGEIHQNQCPVTKAKNKKTNKTKLNKLHVIVVGRKIFMTKYTITIGIMYAPSFGWRFSNKLLQHTIYVINFVVWAQSTNL